MNKPLPWTLNEILCDLETANITNLHLPSSHNDNNLPNPIAFKVMNHKYGHHQRQPIYQPHQKDHRPPPMASTQKQTSVFFATTNTQTHGILKNNVLSKIPL
jgi:hypothetical protein